MMYERLREYCRKHKISGKEFAVKSGLSEQTASRLLTGATELGEGALSAIFHGLAIDPADIYYIVSGEHYQDPVKGETELVRYKTEAEIYRRLYDQLLDAMTKQRGGSEPLSGDVRQHVTQTGSGH